MSTEPTFETLMTQLRAGEEDAATQLFRRYAGRLIALARSRLDQRVQQKIDPEDVMQSVMKSFFWRQKEGQWDLQSWDSLWSLLALMTIRKCGRRAGYFRGGRRDVRREVAQQGEANDTVWNLDVMDREPSPDDAAILTETVAQMLSELKGYHRDIVGRALEGAAVPDIARETGVTERSVQRVLKRVRERLEEILSGDD